MYVRKELRIFAFFYIFLKFIVYKNKIHTYLIYLYEQIKPMKNHLLKELAIS